MSRDYKKPDPSSSKNGESSLFTGVLIGLIVGLGVAIGVALYINFSPKAFTNPEKPAVAASKLPAKPAETSQKSNPDDPANKNGKPRFDFYTILPGSEGPVSDHEIAQAAKQESPLKDGYFLQVGAFQAASEADNMKAKLALLGLEAVIQTAEVPEKGVWHRVRIGPFGNIEDMSRSRTLLAQNNIPSSLVKVKDATTP